MHIALGCDHRGVELEKQIVKLLTELGYAYQDFGTNDSAPVDYPDFAFKVAQAVAQGKAKHGILVCSTGIGMCMAANKVKGVRAALCHDTFTARHAREHNDANVLCLGQSVVGTELALDIVRTYLATEFEGGRHQRRLDKMQTLECQG